jgi:hypothetical protein
MKYIIYTLTALNLAAGFWKPQLLIFLCVWLFAMAAMWNETDRKRYYTTRYNYPKKLRKQ